MYEEKKTKEVRRQLKEKMEIQIVIQFMDSKFM